MQDTIFQYEMARNDEFVIAVSDTIVNARDFCGLDQGRRSVVINHTDIEVRSRCPS